MVKYVFVSGGVISGVGKGIATASIGRILMEYGYSVTAIKIDPYINCDAGTLRPTEHGEVWVTDDGGEIDQDLGNYERFLEIPILKQNAITTGQIYRDIIEKERKGDYLGKTVSVIPHVPDEIRRRIETAAEGYDIALIEIGGTVGDYENIPFLFTARSMEASLGRDAICHVLVTYLPVPHHIDEMKTKPTQLAIKMLRENGIQPDFILCRGRQPLDSVRRKKIERFANMPGENIISAPDVATEGKRSTIYSVPLNLEREGLGEKLLRRLSLPKMKGADWSSWAGMVERMVSPTKRVRIALVGKYLDVGSFQLTDSYLSVASALLHAGAKHDTWVDIAWVNSKDLEAGSVDLAGYDGILVPGGFGSSGVEGKIEAIRYARETKTPFLGLCYGLQFAVIEFARNVCGLTGAHTREVDSGAQHTVVDILPEQLGISEKGGTMRLGSYKATLKEGTLAANIYGSTQITERHRHRYEVNPDYHEILTTNGLTISGTSPDGRLAEFIELQDHPFFIATQAHPEFKSYPMKPSPLFDSFINSCLVH